MTLLDRLPGRADLALAATGMMLTAIFVAGVERVGPRAVFVVLFGGAAFAGLVAAFLAVPHVAVAFTVVYFALLPTLQVFVALPTGTKELVTVAALLAAAILFVRRRSVRAPGRLDGWLTVLFALLFGLYAVNIGGGLTGETGHDDAWFHGIRLFWAPLCLFIAGASLRNPRRTLHWGLVALVAVGVINSLYGLLQQAIGVQGLMDYGYRYGSQVREISGSLRSFGTVDEPFAYAGLLLLALAAVFLWFRRSWWTTLAFGVIALGLLVSYVRTAALIVVALAGVAAARRGHGRYAVLLILAASAIAAATFASASQKTADRAVQVNPTTYLTLNGRTNIWKSTLDSPADWLFGRGVGATGTASQRATRTLGGEGYTGSSGGTVVDSSYFAIIADVGVVGLAVLLVLFALVLERARTPARRGDRAAWLATGLLTVTLLDGLTRESFVGFPTAYIAMLLTGVAWAVWTTEPRPDTPPPLRR